MDLYLMRDIELQLRQAAEEIRRKNHNGWGNVCEQAADALANALDELAAERARADAAVAEAAEHKMFREESARRLKEVQADRDRLRAEIVAAARDTDNSEHYTHPFNPYCAKCRLDELREKVVGERHIAR